MSDDANEITALRAEVARLTAENTKLKDGIREGAACVHGLLLIAKAVEKHLPILKEMAAQIINPRDNLLSRMVRDFEEALGNDK